MKHFLKVIKIFNFNKKIRKTVLKIKKYIKQF